MRLAVDLRPLLETRESGVSVYTKAMIQALSLHDELELDLFYQARSVCPHIHDLFPNVRHIPLSNTIFHIRTFFGFPNLPSGYFNLKPDLIWIPDRRPFYKTYIPIVMTVHDGVPELCPSTLSLKSKLWHRFFSLKRLLSLCSGVLLPSLTSGVVLPRTVKKQVTYEGAELAKKMVEPKGERALAKRPFFLSISPADPRKRLELVVKMAKRFPKLNFVIIGLKSKDRRFARLCLDELSNLKVYQSVSEEEKKWFIKHCQALLALSSYEGFDLPVLEAVHAKKSVIMSDIAVHRELYDGAVFVKDEADLISAIHSYSKEAAPVPKKKGPYTWENAAKRALLFFRRVVADENR